MAEEENIGSSKEVQREMRGELPNDGGSTWWLYILGIIILVVVGFLIFRGKKPAILTGSKTTGTVSVTPMLTSGVEVTIEAEVQQVIATQDTFFIKSVAGYTTLNYDLNTQFSDETGQKTSVDLIKSGTKVKASGTPSGKVFNARKIILISGGSVKPLPTAYKLPETGIVE